MEYKKVFWAEVFGTFILVFGGCGAAVFAGAQIGYLGVSLAFGLSLMAAAYIVGPVSGAHLNPAISTAFAALGRLTIGELALYITAQILGGLFAGLVLYFIASGKANFAPETGFASNGYDIHSPGGYSVVSCFVTEALLTYFLVIAVLSTTRSSFPKDHGGIVVGLVLMLLLLVGIPITNASLNPVRSLATAVFAGGWAMDQLWLFFVAPIFGSFGAILSWKCMCEEP